MAYRSSRGRAALIALLAIAFPALAEDDPPPLSPAQRALFESDHLHGIDRAERLEYSYRRDATNEADTYSDRVELDVRPRPDGGKNVWVDFLSGDRHRPYPPLIGFHGNPVIMYFLEHDVGEMNRQTGGAATYFRNVIRRAFLDRAAVRPIEVERAGKRVSATEIILTPFKEDERIAVFPGIAGKQYRFVLSDAVPGSVVEIEASAPSSSGAFSSKETMMFVSEAACPGESGPCSAASQP